MTIPSNKDKFIIYGEAPESDDEEDNTAGSQHAANEQLIDKTRDTSQYNNKSSVQSLFSLTSSSSALAKIFNYQQAHSGNAAQKFTRDQKDRIFLGSTLDLTSLPLLHKTLYVKNQQLRRCFEQAHRQPYDKVSQDLHSISQRLVDAQKIIQNVDSLLVKLLKSNPDLLCFQSCSPKLLKPQCHKCESGARNLDDR